MKRTTNIWNHYLLELCKEQWNKITQQPSSRHIMCVYLLSLVQGCFCIYCFALKYFIAPPWFYCCLLYLHFMVLFLQVMLCSFISCWFTAYFLHPFCSRNMQSAWNSTIKEGYATKNNICLITLIFYHLNKVYRLMFEKSVWDNL